MTHLADGAVKYLALDRANVYFTTNDGVKRVTKQGGDVTPIIEQQAPGSGIVVDGTNVFWASSSPAGILKCSLAGCSSATKLTTTQEFPYGVASDDTSIYWVVSSAASAGGSLRKVDKNGANPQVLASAQDYAQSVAVDDASVYWTNAGSGGAVMKSPKSGGTPTNLRTSASGTPRGIALDNAYVYFTLSTDGEIQRIAKSGGVPESLTKGQEQPDGVAVDGSAVYWSVRGSADINGTSGPADGAIAKYALPNGPMTTLATGQAQPSGIAVDDKYVYWVNSGDNSVMRVAK